MLDRCDVLPPNEAEAHRCTGVTSTPVAAQRLARRVGTVAITSVSGAHARRGEDVVDVEAPRVEPTTIVDTVGAGDNFDAGFLFGYINHWDLERCVRAGLGAAARSLGGRGGTGALDPIEEALLRG
jgi:sugar/nucleoside kinase (ribokinase family)